MKLKRNFFLSLLPIICLCILHSCSNFKKTDHNRSNYRNNQFNKKDSGNYTELTQDKFLFSKKDWLALKHIPNKKIKFQELKIDDFGFQKEKVNKTSIDYPFSIKIIELNDKNKVPKIKLIGGFNNKNENEVTVLFIHGLGGKEGDFFPLIKKLVECNYNGKVNFIAGKRFDSCFKSIKEQALEVLNKLEEYLKKNNKKTKLILVGHSQGGFISLELLPSLINNPYILEISGIVLIGTPLHGINSVIDFMNKKRREYPIIISMVEKSIFGCTFGKNPKGITDTLKENQGEVLDKANEIIKQYKIPTKVLIGIKPKNVEFPNSIFSITKKLMRLLNNNILHLDNSKKANDKNLPKFKTFKEFCKGLLNLKDLLNSKKICDCEENDSLLSAKTQTWPKNRKNQYVEEEKLYGVVHNWKISLLVSDSINKRIAAELESNRTKKIVEKMIKNTLKPSIKKEI